MAHTTEKGEYRMSSFGRPKGEKGPRGKLERISIEPAENGFTVEVSRRQPEPKVKSDKNAPGGCEWKPPVKMVFEDEDGVLACVKEELS